MARAPRAAATMGCSPREGLWCWDVPGQEHPLHLVQEPLRHIQHRVRDNLRCHSSRQLEARRPVTFGALWTAARVSGHGTRTNFACPHCGAAHEDKVHVLWDCPEGERARETCRP